MKLKSITKALNHWIPLAVTITIMSGLIYVTNQQSLRFTANDPQIQMSEDISRALINGKAPFDVVPTETVDIASSLAPYVIVYGPNGVPIAGSGQLHNKIPTVPDGVLAYVRDHGEDRLTWEPEYGVRSAVVLQRYDKGYVMVGRSIREVEAREDQLGLTVGAAWVSTMLLSLIAVYLLMVE